MITLTLYPDYGFKVHIDDAHVGDICPSGDEYEWAAYRVGPTGRVQRKRIGTAKDIFDVIDLLEYTHHGIK